MSTGLQVHSEIMSEWKLLCDQAAILVKTGFLPQSIKTPEQAVAIVLTGRELGIGMMAALNNINVIQGKPTVPPQLMLALINRTNQVEDINVKTSEQGATCTIKRRGRSPYTAHFGPAEAMKMGLSGKDNYKKQPATMYQWRAIAAACRVTFSDVLHGLYLPDELGAEVDGETGEVITLPDDDIQPVRQIEAPADEPPTIEAEPESVRTVKLESAQPPPEPSSKLPSLRGYAGQITALANQLGWTEAYLREEVIAVCKIELIGELAVALPEIPPADAKVMIQSMKAELENRNRTK